MSCVNLQQANMIKVYSETADIVDLFLRIRIRKCLFRNQLNDNNNNINSGNFSIWYLVYMVIIDAIEIH